MEAKLEWLTDPRVFRVNRLDAHSDHHFYENLEDMRQGRETLRQSLNGIWKFHWCRNPKERPVSFYREDFPLESFEEIQVPMPIELQGYDRIHYTNYVYPWDGRAFLQPPMVDEEYNTAGSYVKEFDLDAGLVGKRVCVSFQGAEQALYVWLNGEFVGYGEDSFTPSEFDITELVREKGNRLCVRVYKKSSASWIEDQDFFRFSGLFRDVYLYAKPESHVEDLWIKAGLMEDYQTGVLEAQVKVSGERPVKAVWFLEDEDGDRVLDGELEEAAESAAETGKAAESGEAAFYRIPMRELLFVKSWDVNAPYLYRLCVVLLDGEGRTVEAVPYRVGFRRFEIKNRIMHLNGRRLIINGVNRHEWNPRRGRSVTEEDMRKDIEILRRNHINAVRTCHYPNQSRWYELCDEAGICVMDETNLESHNSWQKYGFFDRENHVPGAFPEWKDCVVDRAASMLQRDKNHPCILWWSCGNESFAGECILAMSKYFHDNDPTRPVHYEGVNLNRKYDAISDVESQMYTPAAGIRRYLENDPKKPFLLCEYMHDMGNSIGGMESYIRLLEKYPMYQGGFIWDYIDQAVYQKDEKGREVLRYGGDFDDRPTDYAFCANGIVFADRTEKPAMQEVRYWYSDPKKRKEQDRINAEKYAVAAEECRKREIPENARMRVIFGDANVGVTGEGFSYLFSFAAGGPVSLVMDGQEQLYRAPRPAFWRASTENDKGNHFPEKSAAWLGADSFSRCAGCLVREISEEGTYELNPQDTPKRKSPAANPEEVEFVYTYHTGTVPDTTVTVSYRVVRDGSILVTAHYEGREGLPQLPEFGLRFILNGKADKIRWQGLSGETYPDRKKGGVFGNWESPVAVSDYLVPQECQNHADTCQAWVRSLHFVMDQEPFHISALPYTPQELESALHKEELPDTGRTVVSVLGRMRGVGGIDSWGADVEEAYHISGEEDITFSFWIAGPGR